MIISRYLKEYNIDFIPQYKFDDCINKKPLPFDFYLPNNNICIEFDGPGHFKPIQWHGISKTKAKDIYRIVRLHDKIKNEYCSKNNIRLIRIPYTDIKNVNGKLISYLLKN